MNRLLILIIILVILAGGGLWWWLSSTSNRPPIVPPTDPSQVFPVIPPLVIPTNQPITPAGDDSLSPIPAPVIPIATSPNPRLIPLSARAVAGVTIIKAATSTESERVLFLERETGLIVEMDLTNQGRKELARLPVRALINEAVLDLKSTKLSVWFSTISGDEKKYFRSILDLKPAASTTTSFNSNLPEMSLEPMGSNTREFALSPTREQLFTLEQVGEETIGKIFDAKNPKGRLVFESKINQWLTSWPEKNLIALATKPANRAMGYLFWLNPRNDINDPQKIIGGLNGLTALISPDGQKVLYARSATPNLELVLYNRTKNESRVLAIATMVEKCVWADDSSTIYCAVPRSWPPAIYPDDYLSGEIATDDLLWRINTADGLGRSVWSDEPGLSDAINLLTADQNKKILFTDRLTDQLYLINELIL